MDNTLLTVLSALFILVLGSYGFSFTLFLQIMQLKYNHIVHIEARLTSLESRADESSHS